MIELPKQMSQTNLVSEGWNHKVRFPTIMNHNRKRKAFREVIVDCLHTAIVRGYDVCEQCSLESPEPSFFSVDHCSGFITAIRTGVFSTGSDKFVGGQCFFSNPLNRIG